MLKLSSFVKTKNNLDWHQKYVKIKIFNVVMSSEDTKLLEFNQYEKSDKTPFFIYADL